MGVYLIYASTSGNVEIVMETVEKVLKGKGFKVLLSRAEKTSPETVKKNQMFIFGTSTWEHGRLNPFFDRLLEEIEIMDCGNKQAAFVGLGDRRYEPVLFCDGIEQIRRLWLKKGGKQIGTVLKIQGEPYEQLDSTVTSWASQLAQTFVKNRA